MFIAKELFNTWKFRVPFATICSPFIALVIGYISSLNVTPFEGAQGYHFFYIFLYTLPIVFITLLINRVRLIQLIAAVIAILGLLLVLLG